MLSKYKVPRCKIAKALGVSDNVLAAMLSGKNIRLESAEKVAKYTGRKIENLCVLLPIKRYSGGERIRWFVFIK